MQHFTTLSHKNSFDLKVENYIHTNTRYTSMHAIKQNSENARKMSSLLVSRHHVTEFGDRGYISKKSS